jgi:two-component system, NtrC family, response regulator HydG
MLSTPTVLVVDDDQANLSSLAVTFEREGWRAVTASNGKEALDLLRQSPVDVVLTDLAMPGIDGLDLLKNLKKLRPETEVILMTAYGTVEKAVEAMKEGADDFVTKPFKRAQIVKAVKKCLEKQALLLEVKDLKHKIQTLTQRTIVGQSEGVRKTLETIKQAASSQATILIQAENGTGKELLARAVHDYSQRRDKPFIPVNCGAIPETLFEAELFGHEKGSFTGAAYAREGKFTQANHGTLFLDEISETPIQLQVKLLRAIAEREIEPIGGKPHKVDVRVVAATNRDLKKLVEEGKFRQDLYFRLNVINVSIPPLRDRRDDIPLLADHFLQKYKDQNGRANITGISREAIEVLTSYDWPGNVRELENAVQRAVVLCTGNVITARDLPEQIGVTESIGRTLSISVGTSLEEIERRVIQETLRLTKGDKRLAAQLLGIATRTIYRKLDRGSIEDPNALEDDDA